MYLYNYLFFFIYRFIKSIELEIPSVKHNDRVFETICAMTIIQIFNVITIFDPNDRQILWVPIGVIFFINCIVFYNKKRFRNIINQFTTTHPSTFTKIAVLGYLTVSLLAFVIIRLVP